MMTRLLLCAAAIVALPLAAAAAPPRDHEQRRDAGNISSGDAGPALKLARDHRRRDDDRDWRHDRRDAYDDDDRGPPGHRKKWRKGRRGPPGKRHYGFRGNGPPPWAPAHGWRHKRHRYSGYRYHRESSVVTYIPPFALDRGGCNRETLGAALGGLVGAAVGSRLSRDSSRGGRTMAVVGGTILGVLVGGSIGSSMDNVDQHCVGQALEHARDDQPVRWRTDHGAQYEVKPTETYRDPDDRYCREYQTTIIVGGQSQQAYGRACRQPDGSWEKVSS